MSYFKIGPDSFLSRLKNIRGAYSKSDSEYAQEKIDKYLSTSIYEDNALLKTAVKYLMEVIEAAAPMHDGICIKITTNSDSPIPGTSQIGKIMNMMNSDDMLKESSIFKRAFRRYMHNEICTLVMALSNKTGIPIVESVSRDCGITIRYEDCYIITVWWNEYFCMDSTFASTQKKALLIKKGLLK